MKIKTGNDKFFTFSVDGDIQVAITAYTVGIGLTIIALLVF
jgi:hypothetical protein